MLRQLLFLTFLLTQQVSADPYATLETDSAVSIISTAYNLKCTITNLPNTFTPFIVQFDFSKLLAVPVYAQIGRYTVNTAASIGANVYGNNDVTTTANANLVNFPASTFNVTISPRTLDGAGMFRCSVQYQSQTERYFSDVFIPEGIFPLGEQIEFSLGKLEDSTEGLDEIEVGERFFAKCNIGLQGSTSAYQVGFYLDDTLLGQYVGTAFVATPTWNSLNPTTSLNIVKETASKYPNFTAIIKPISDEARGIYHCEIQYTTVSGVISYSSNKLDRRGGQLSGINIPANIKVTANVLQGSSNQVTVQCSALFTSISSDYNYNVDFLMNNVSIGQFVVDHDLEPNTKWSTLTSYPGLNIFTNAYSAYPTFSATIVSEIYGFNETRCAVQCLVTLEIPNLGNAIYYSEPYNPGECKSNCYSIGLSLSVLIGLILFRLNNLF